VYAIVAVGINTSLPDFESRYGISLPLLMALDLAGGGLGGAIVGALLPRARSAITYVLVAQAAVLPASCLFALTDSVGTGLEAGIAAGVLVGTYLGLFMWWRHKPRPPS